MGDAVITFPTLDQLAAAADLGSSGSVPDQSPSAGTDVLIGQNSQVSWQTRDVQPPSNLYVTSSDRIQVSWWTLSGPGEIDIAGRLLEPNGSIKLIAFAIPATAPATPGVFTFSIAEGFLLDLVATCPNASVQRGDLFVQVAIVRGNTTSPIVSHVLLQDYVWTKSIAQWPGSPVRDPREGPGSIIQHLLQPNPGTDWSFTVATNTRARIRHIGAQLTTSATAINRQVAVIVKNPSGTQIFTVGCQVVEGANANTFYAIGPAIGLSTLSQPFQTVALPEDLMLEASWSIQAVTLNIQIGDSWANVYCVTESWISPA